MTEALSYSANVLPFLTQTAGLQRSDASHGVGGPVGRGDQRKKILGEILAHEFCYSRTNFLGKVGVSSTSNKPEWASESEKLSETCGIGAFRCAFLFREPSRWRVGGAGSQTLTDESLAKSPRRHPNTL